MGEETAVCDACGTGVDYPPDVALAVRESGGTVRCGDCGTPIFGDGHDGDVVVTSPEQLTRDATYKTVTGDDLVRIFGGRPADRVADSLIDEIIDGHWPVDDEEAGHLIHLMASEIKQRRRAARFTNYKQKQIKRCRQAIEKLVETLGREETKRDE